MSFDIAYAFSCIPPIIAKFPITMYMSMMATLTALLLGIIFSVILQTKVPVLSQIVHFLSSFLKGVPVLVLLYIIYYSMPTVMVSLSAKMGFEYDLRNPPKLLFAILAFGVTYAPYMSDMILSALNTIPKGQMEACHAMGFTTLQAMRRVILPQLVVVAFPNFGNHFINMLKATSLAYMVTIVEMMGAAKNFAVANQLFLETYIVGALIYWGVCIGFERIFAALEKNIGKYEVRTVPEKTSFFKFGLKALLTPAQ